MSCITFISPYNVLKSEKKILVGVHRAEQIIQYNVSLDFYGCGDTNYVTFFINDKWKKFIFIFSIFSPPRDEH